jgi:hypothetical protein
MPVNTSTANVNKASFAEGIWPNRNAAGSQLLPPRRSRIAFVIDGRPAREALEPSNCRRERHFASPRRPKSWSGPPCRRCPHRCGASISTCRPIGERPLAQQVGDIASTLDRQFAFIKAITRRTGVIGGSQYRLLGRLNLSRGGTDGSQTRRWRKADSNSWSHFSARALEPLRNLSLRWDLRAAYRSEANLPPIPSECAWSVVVVTVLRGPRRGFAGYAITGFFGAGRGGVGRMRSDVVPGVEGLRTFGAPHRRAAPDPSETIA